MVPATPGSGRRAGRLASRRLAALAALLPAASTPGDAMEVCVKAAELLHADSELFPFVLIYLFEPERPRLAAAVGLSAQGAPALDPAAWPLHEATSTGLPIVVRGIRPRLGAGAAALPEGVDDAIAVPIAGRQAEPSAIGALVAGVAQRFAKDRDHPTFMQLVAGQLHAALAAVGWAEESAALQDKMARTQELEQLKSEFLRLASHELRGPLAVIRGYLDLVDGGTFGRLPAAMVQVLPIVISKIDEMNRLVEQMLETARLDENRLTLNRQPLDLREIARESAGALAPLAEGTHPFRYRLPAEPVVVLGDRTRVAGVITNVIDNAIKYSPEGGQIAIECSVDETSGTALLRVRDRGLGIADADLPRLFKRFGRIVTSDNSHISGTGLGLYLARELTRMHGGDVSLVSAPGQGTEVTIRLPLAVTDASPETAPGPAAAATAKT